jgi:hypothetical protein
MEPTNRISDHIDHETARSIRGKVGDRLKQNLSLEASPLPPYLERLVDELRNQERHPIDGVAAPANRFLHATRRVAAAVRARVKKKPSPRWLFR